MILNKTKHGDITIYHVDKIITDEKMEELKNTFVKPSQIKLIINHDCDVFTKEGNLLLRFRKSKLKDKNINTFYNNIIKFAKTETNNRGSATGSKIKDNAHNPLVMTNIFGYMDTLAPKQKFKLSKLNKKILHVRECRFNRDNPELYNNTLPFIQEIDKYYKKYIPDKYKLQRKKADQTYFKIPNTAFTTITTNVNFQTTMHTDKGDDPEGFGNLVVVENGEYTGAETCFPQYGIGVNVRTGDVLFMNVHEIHGNLPIKKKNKDVIRLSIVCYLRVNLFEKTKHKTKKFLIQHNKTCKKIFTS